MNLSRPGATATWLAMLAACRTSAVPDRKAGAVGAIASERAASVDGGLASLDASAPVRVSSPFAPVTHVGVMRLQRITGSPVLGIDADSNLIWELAASGTPRLIEPLAGRVVASERPPFITIGRVAGRWPAIHVEYGFGTGRGDPTIHNYLVDDAKQTIKPFAAPYGHIAASSPWVDGSELAWASSDTSYMSPGMAKVGVFTVVGGPKRPVPKVPKTLAAIDPKIAAYGETGRVFFLAGVQHEEPEWVVDEKIVWSFLGASATPMPMPMPMRGMATHLVRGRNEAETLVAGSLGDDPNHGGPPFLARFDGSVWQDVPLPFHEPVRAIDAGDDGSVWIATGVRAQRTYPEGGEVWRGVLPDLRFERVPIPPGLAPISVSATTVRDAWLVAADPGSTRGATLLHTQPASTAKVDDLPTEPTDIARLTIGKREPTPFTPSCLFAFLAFGKESELTEPELVAFGKAQPDWHWSQRGVLARLPSGEKLWGVEVYAAYPKVLPEDLVLATSLQTRARARFKGAKLLCTALPIEREVEVLPPPPPHPPPPGARPPKPDGAPPRKKK